MYIDNIITGDGIFQEIDRICGTNNINYPYKDKVSRLNMALNKYFIIAFSLGKQWNFDDINETSPPIDTQNIVSGTNRYKFSAFTEKILSLIRLELLSSDAKGLPLIPEVMNNLKIISPGNKSGRISGFNQGTFQSLYIDAPAGTPTHYIKYGDFIYLRPNPNYSETGGLIAYFDRALATIAFARATVTAASPGLFTATAHGLAENDTVVLITSGALLTGLEINTTYYVISAGLTTNAFELSTTLGGSAINTSGSQSGVHTFLKTNQSPGIPAIHHTYLAREASLSRLIEKGDSQAGDIASLIREDEININKYFSERGEDIKSRLVPSFQNNK